MHTHILVGNTRVALIYFVCTGKYETFTKNNKNKGKIKLCAK